MKPCPCTYFGSSQKLCTCASAVVTKYQKRISGPLLDRIDIHIEVPRVDYEKLSGDRLGESSESIRKRVQTARDIQHARFSNSDSRSLNVLCNADMRIGCTQDNLLLRNELNIFDWNQPYLPQYRVG
jgi:magnesium chelatase family protein